MLYTVQLYNPIENLSTSGSSHFGSRPLWLKHGQLHPQAGGLLAIHSPIMADDLASKFCAAVAELCCCGYRSVDNTDDTNMVNKIRGENGSRNLDTTSMVSVIRGDIVPANLATTTEDQTGGFDLSASSTCTATSVPSATLTPPPLPLRPPSTRSRRSRRGAWLPLGLLRLPRLAQPILLRLPSKVGWCIASR